MASLVLMKRSGRVCSPNYKAARRIWRSEKGSFNWGEDSFLLASCLAYKAQNLPYNQQIDAALLVFRKFRSHNLFFMPTPAVTIEGVSYHYGERRALKNFSLEVEQGSIFGLLGPNGGGKTTLFKLLATLLPLQDGNITIDGHCLRTQGAQVRQQLGVVFQAPSLDKKLTVQENLVHQGHLYGLRGETLRKRILGNLELLQLADRSKDLVETLSGGLQRRVELAKALLHQPRLLLLDEPSTGLDPGVRMDLWNHLHSLNQSHGLTLLLTTHLLDEAEFCNRIALLDAGELIAEGSPDQLKKDAGAETIRIETSTPDLLAESIRIKLQLESSRDGRTLILQNSPIPNSGRFALLENLTQNFSTEIDSISASRPSLEDVYRQKTGRAWKNTEVHS